MKIFERKYEKIRTEKIDFLYRIDSKKKGRSFFIFLLESGNKTVIALPLWEAPFFLKRIGDEHQTTKMDYIRLD